MDTVLRNPLLGVVLRSSSGNAPGILEISDCPNCVSFRNPVPDSALFTAEPLGVPSVLRRPSLMLGRASFAASRKLLPLPDRRISGLSAVSGGLGGGFVGTFAGVEFLRFSRFTSVAAGVMGLMFRTSSMLPTISLLCALLNVGYEIRGLTSSLEPLAGRCSISGTAISTFFLLLRSERGESLSRSRSRLVDLLRCSFPLLNLCTLLILSRELVDSRSFSPSPSPSRSPSRSSLRLRRFGSPSRTGVGIVSHSRGNPRGLGYSSKEGIAVVSSDLSVSCGAMIGWTLVARGITSTFNARCSSFTTL